MGGKEHFRHAATVLAAAMLLAGCVQVSSAPAEVVQRGGVRISVTGTMSPTRLPRSGSAPVAVSMAGHLAPTEPGVLPKLARIAIAINARGELHNRSTPVCRLGR